MGTNCVSRTSRAVVSLAGVLVFAGQLSAQPRLREIQEIAGAERQYVAGTTAKLTFVQQIQRDTSIALGLLEEARLSGSVREETLASTREMIMASADQAQRCQVVADGAARKYTFQVTNLHKAREHGSAPQDFSLIQEQGNGSSLRSLRAHYNVAHEVVTLNSFDRVTVGDHEVPTTVGFLHEAYLARAEKHGAHAVPIREDGKNLVEIAWDNDGTFVRVQLHPELGYRVRRFEVRDSEGRLIRLETAGDYRIIDGVPFPHRCEITRWRPGSNEVTYHRVTEIEEARFGIELKNNDFAIGVPAGTAVVDYVSNSPLLEEAVVDHDLFLTLQTIPIAAQGLMNTMPGGKDDSGVQPEPQAGTDIPPSSQKQSSSAKAPSDIRREEKGTS